MARRPVDEASWRALLEGTDPGLIRLKRIFRQIPSAPRCKLCESPFGQPGYALMLPLGHRRWAANPALCTVCVQDLERQRGGAEVDVAFLFADIRGSTGIAERTNPGDFRRLLDRFYGAAARAIDDAGGVVDKYLGDGVVGMFVPAFKAGVRPALAAVEAATGILRSTGHGRAGAAWLPVGVGVHFGRAFVGVLGVQGGQLDFTGVGDAVNVAARLGSLASDGEALVTESTLLEAGLRLPLLERRTLELKGRNEPVDVVVLSAATEVRGGGA